MKRLVPCVLMIALALLMRVNPAIANTQNSQTIVGSQADIAKAEHLVGLLGYDKQVQFALEKMLPFFGSQVVADMSTQGASDPLFQKFMSSSEGRDELEAMFNVEFQKAFGKRVASMKAEAAKQYAQRLSESELQELIEFFSKGSGQKYIAYQPEMMATMSDFGRKAGGAAGKEAFEAVLLGLKAGQAAKSKTN